MIVNIKINVDNLSVDVSDSSFTINSVSSDSGIISLELSKPDEQNTTMGMITEWQQ